VSKIIGGQLETWNGTYGQVRTRTTLILLACHLSGEEGEILDRHTSQRPLPRPAYIFSLPFSSTPKHSPTLRTIADSLIPTVPCTDPRGSVSIYERHYHNALSYRSHEAASLCCLSVAISTYHNEACNMTRITQNSFQSLTIKVPNREE
jgi:hypothetical protein